MSIKGYLALIRLDPDADMFRGDFVGLTGGADFYTNNFAGLEAAGVASLKVFLDVCKKKGIDSSRLGSEV